MRKTVPMCCFCEKVRDDLAAKPQAKERWQEFSTYLATFGLTPEEIQLSHTYCPDCIESHKDALGLPR